MFTVADTVTNAGGGDVSLSAYGRITRFDKPLVASTYVLHEGLIGVTGEKAFRAFTYGNIEKEKQVVPGKSTDGWLGITDKYWAATLVPIRRSSRFQPRFSHFDDGRPRYQCRLPDRPDRGAIRAVGDGRDAGLRRRQGSRHHPGLRNG